MDFLKEGFNPGGLPHITKQTDFDWNNIGAALPPFNWEQGFDIELTLEGILKAKGFKLPVKNQNGSGSCGGQETSQYQGVLEAAATGSYEERSAKAVIAQTFVVDQNGVMLGSTFESNSQLAIKKGIPREILCPSYDNGQPPSDAFMNRPQDIDEAAVADAKNAKSRSYAFVAPSIDNFAQAAGANYGLGMLLRGSNNGTWYSPNPVPGASDWGHFMYIGKALLVNGKKKIKALQSWGKNVGEDGWQWFGEDWFASGKINIGRTMIFDDSIPVPQKYLFTRDLYVGKTGIDVRFLQVFLNTHGFKLANSGAGSPGKETSTFGELTRQALAAYQRARGISPTAGYFGSITRKRVNAEQ